MLSFSQDQKDRRESVSDYKCVHHSSGKDLVYVRHGKREIQQAEKVRIKQSIYDEFTSVVFVYFLVKT